MIEVEGDKDIVGNNYVLLAQRDVGITGLRPDTRDSNGKIIEPNNLTDLAEEARAIFAEIPWYRSLLREVRQNKKSAIFIAALGGITIFVAGTAGFEFGVRHGQDLRHLPRILRKKK